MDLIEKYYNKFNEDKRLNSRHGQVEFYITLKKIKEILKEFENPKILDVGAGTGAYSVFLSNAGYDVTAVEYVKHNLRVLEQKNSNVKAMQGDARNLKKLKDNSFDITLLFGPLYHLFSLEDKLKALSEAKRVTKDGGIILAMFYMNDYAIIKHGFIDGNIIDSINKGLLDKNFKIFDNIENLYSYSRLEDIEQLEQLSNLQRIKLVGVDGATDYIRPVLNKMDEATFNLFLEYQTKISELQELLGASSHILDILKVIK